MSTRILKFLAIVLPVSFMLAVVYLRVSFFSPENASEGNFYTFLVVALGATAFSIFIFNVIEHREEEIRQRSLQLEALHEAALALTNELDLQIVLQKVVDLSRELLNAKYGALGVLDDDGERIAHFFTSGLSDGLSGQIGQPPHGSGLLGVLSPGGQSLIVDSIEEDPRSAGFPPNHPDMLSLLGVPIKSKGEVFGNLYLADKLSEGRVDDHNYLPFEESDRQLLEKFATQAAIAIENAQLYRKTQELAVLKERERFSMDLHDGIMQSVYATGLSLQEAQLGIDGSPEEAVSRIDNAIQDLSQVLRDIRNYILGLRPDRFKEHDLVTGISEIARELRANTLLNVNFDAPNREEFPIPEADQVSEMLMITQEALANVRKHALARNVDIELNHKNGEIILTIQDDGTGFNLDSGAEPVGNGLPNMRERATNLGADIFLDSKNGKGTSIRLSVPFTHEEDSKLKEQI
jgi:signal transduction histidine kinase